MTDRRYYGWAIERVFPSGYWLARKVGETRLMADTLDGLRGLIRSQTPGATNRNLRGALMADARKTARYRGHELGRWIPTAYGSHVASCRAPGCTGYAQVTPRPLPNEIDVGGSAVAVNCPTKD